MNISNVQAGTAVYNAVNANAKPAISAGLESNSSISTNPVDSVTISEKAKKTAENASLEDKAQELYMDWQAQVKGAIYLPEEKSYDSLLSENQDYLEELERKYQLANPDEKKRISDDISMVSRYGDQEILNSAELLENKNNVFHRAVNMLAQDVIANPEEYPSFKGGIYSKAEFQSKFGGELDSNAMTSSSESSQFVSVDREENSLANQVSNLKDYLIQNALEIASR